MTKERTIDRIVNNMFEEIDAFSKLIIIFEIINKKSRASHAKYVFFLEGGGSKCVNMPHINAL